METEDELDEITVLAKKPLYEKQIDRLVVNVQETITAAGSTVLEVLRVLYPVSFQNQTDPIN